MTLNSGLFCFSLSSFPHKNAFGLQRKEQLKQNRKFHVLAQQSARRFPHWCLVGKTLLRPLMTSLPGQGRKVNISLFSFVKLGGLGRKRMVLFGIRVGSFSKRLRMLHWFHRIFACPMSAVSGGARMRPRGPIEEDTAIQRWVRKGQDLRCAGREGVRAWTTIFDMGIVLAAPALIHGL